MEISGTDLQVSAVFLKRILTWFLPREKDILQRILHLRMPLSKLTIERTALKIVWTRTSLNCTLSSSVDFYHFERYELDVTLPYEHLFEIKIMNKNLVGDDLIGILYQYLHFPLTSFLGFINIDIEDRLYGEPRLK